MSLGWGGLLGVGVIMACSPRPVQAPSPEPRESRTAHDTRELRTWEDRAQGSPNEYPEGAPSLGHGDGTWRLRVAVWPPECSDLYQQRRPQREWPDGSVALAEHRTAVGANVTYALVHTGDRWRALAEDEQGERIDTERAGCMTCHQESATGMLFGPPHALLQTPSPRE